MDRARQLHARVRPQPQAVLAPFGVRCFGRLPEVFGHAGLQDQAFRGRQRPTPEPLHFAYELGEETGRRRARAYPAHVLRRSQRLVIVYSRDVDSCLALAASLALHGYLPDGCGLTTLRISCGRNARGSELYGPLAGTGYQRKAESVRPAPDSCMRGLGRLQDPASVAPARRPWRVSQRNRVP